MEGKRHSPDRLVTVKVRSMNSVGWISCPSRGETLISTWTSSILKTSSRGSERGWSLKDIVPIRLEPGSIQVAERVLSNASRYQNSSLSSWICSGVFLFFSTTYCRLSRDGTGWQVTDVGREMRAMGRIRRSVEPGGTRREDPRSATCKSQPEAYRGVGRVIYLVHRCPCAIEILRRARRRHC